MDERDGSRLRRLVGALLMLIGLAASLLAFTVQPAAAVVIGTDPNGTLTGFEIEGDQDDDAPAAIDWATADATVVVDDELDSGLSGTSKENDPSDFVCNVGGANPGKNNILGAAVSSRISADGAFLDLAYARQTGNGDAHVNFEFNQQAAGYDCPNAEFDGRTAGDILLVFDFPGGSDAPNIEGFLWDPGTSPDGQWIQIAAFPPGAAAGSSNAAPIPNTLFAAPVPATLPERTFGEVSLDLAAIFPELFEGDCVTFGTLNVRSRSSGESFNSALQDRLVPTPIDFSTCGSIVLDKTDDAGNALAGATFGLYATEDDAEARTNEIDTCTSVADGTCSFDEVDPGDYFIAEISAPAGYDVDPTIVAVSVDPLEDVEVDYTFVDPRDTGFVTITKAITGIANPPAGSLAGATFELRQGGVVASLWPTPPGNDPATCTIVGNATSCTIGPVPLGTYQVVETAAPAGTTVGPAIPDVVVDEDGETVSTTYSNPPNPISVNLDKSGPDVADIGSTFTYTFAVTNTGTLRLGDVTLTELAPFDDRCNVADGDGDANDGNIDGPVKTGGNQDAFLDPGGETWTYTCQHLVTPADGTSLHNEARAQGTDQFGRTASDTDPHDVAIRYPDLNVVKDGNGTIDAGGTATFTITVTNQGTGPALGSTLTDTLPSGTWTLGGADAAACGIAVGVLTCDFGTIVASPGDDVRSITLSRTVTIADCGTIDNTATASTVYGTTDIDVDGTDNSDSGSVTVTCPDVAVTKTGNGPIDAGDVASFTIVVQNLGQGTATGVTLNDPVLPAGITWTIASDSLPAAPDCTIGASLTCPAFDLAPLASRTIVITGTTDFADCGTLTNTVTVAAGNGDTNPSNNSSTGTVVVRCPDLTIVKTADAAVVDAGDPIGFTITVANGDDAGTGTASDVTLEDELPAGPTWTIDSVTGDVIPTCGIAAGVLSCSAVDLEPGQSYVVAISAATSFDECGAYDNTATAVASNHPEVDDDAQITCQLPDLAIDKVADAPTTVSAGDPVGFTITVSNGDDAGTATAYDVTLNDPLPAALTWSIESQSGGASCQITGDLLTCGPIDLDPGESFSVHVVATTSAAACTQFPNTADAGGSNTGPRIDDTATVLCLLPGLNIVKLADDEVVDAGDDIGFSIQVLNNLQPGGIAQDVVLTDPLPAGVEWTLGTVDGQGVTAPDCAITGAVGSQVLTCDPVDLDPGDLFLVHVEATTSFAACATYDNEATATPSVGSPVSDDALVTCQLPDLAIDKVADLPATVSAGDEVGFTITVSNGDAPGTATADAVELSDPLPAALTWSIESQTGGAGCQIVADLLTCGPIDLDPGESFSVHVVATTSASACATYPNTAEAGGSNTGDPIDDSATVACLLPGVTVDKTADDDVVDAGDPIGFTVVVGNDLAPGGTAYDVVLTDELPSAGDWSLDAVVGDGVTAPDCAITGAVGAEVLTCDAVDLAPGASFTVHVSATTAAGDCATYDNTAVATPSNGDPADDDASIGCLDIEVVKDGPDLAHVGDTVTYTFEVTNTGGVDLVTVELDDPDCDAPATVVDDGDGDATLAVGETWTYECDRLIEATDPDPVPNVAVVTGTDEGGSTTTDDDDHVVDLIAPAIQIVKTVDDVAPDVGQTVTFSYAVTNTGDTTLFDVIVVDDRLGAVGTIPVLAVGQTVVLTKTMLVQGDSPSVNIGTATGSDVLGKTVTDDDPETITVVLGVTVVPPTTTTPPQAVSLPRTGMEVRLPIGVGLLLIGIGAYLTQVGPRRRFSF